ncbi:pirin family protein [Wohlfahrtiimonas chitiniclastica]|uniref:pirin family protein n=1 Tax=Wohlfahrtiimonas chitiniclastica TaxID=400946 RepID=UPI001BCDAF98|nr:pirin family protein [Wohlfahrtiimonas chitiniclastica]MBS7814833.1 pirin family protein [Wohlfahrtiimonas chitiniclastica]MBS7816963.1 pirin family protein [Wohlfahrtiimonas chitiniclastica]MBS7818621.1 pirin family protein [Wohlfahrtiimonas chitiniclastica]MBS7822833.1 pirin family protein [Wohlfahrtiimonas chitiniclastica]MBS7826769.1 pirin family protein [Wohlfahrtiimonas chitiniclastica]
MKTNMVYRANEYNVCERGNYRSHRFFSYGGFYDADRTQFGTLRLLNNNFFTGPGRFGQQHHSDLEVIIMPLNGEIEYTDSRAHRSIVKKEEVLVVSAGTGLSYAINSVNPKEEVNYLKIWVMPRRRGLTPRHQVCAVDTDMFTNRFHYFVAPDNVISKDRAVIHQDAWIAASEVDPKKKITYTKKDAKNGVFIRVCYGDIKVRDHVLSEGDCIAFDDKQDIKIEGITQNRFVLLELPMNVTLYDSEDSITIPPKM